MVAAIVIVQLAAVLMLVSGVRDRLAGQVAASAQVSLDFLAESVADRTERFVRPVEKAVQVAHALIGKGLLDAEDDAMLETYFLAQLDGIASLAGMYVGRDDGSFLYVSRNELGLRTKAIRISPSGRSVTIVQRAHDGSVLETWNDPADTYDPRERPWHAAAKVSEGLAWTDPYTFYSTGLPGITVASKTGGGTVLGADIDIADLSDFVSTIPHARSGSAMITDAGGRVIARSSQEASGPVEPGSDMATVADVASTSMLALYDSMKRQPSRASSDTTRLEVDGREYIGLVSPISLASDRISWTLLVQVPIDDYAHGTLGWFERGRTVLGILSIGLGLLTLAGIGWLHQISLRAARDAETDPLTGAYLREPFERLTRKALQSSGAGKDARCHAVMVIDLRNLRYCIDSSGLAAGDRVLKAAGDALRSGMDKRDLLGRSFLSRFTIHLVGTDEALLIDRAKLLDALVRQTVADTFAGQKPIKVASGAAVFEPGEPAANVQQRAREAVSASVDDEDAAVRVAGRFASAHPQRLDRAA